MSKGTKSKLKEQKFIFFPMTNATMISKSDGYWNSIKLNKM